jgi:hypothetical protein
MICARGDVPKEISSKKDKRWTTLSVNTFSGKQAMLVIIILGTKRNLTVESGIDMFAKDVIGQEDDIDFFENNYGPGKRFPGGPTCIFRGKKIPCMIRYSESGGITAEILTDILRTFDTLDVFADARLEGIRPMLLIDGHSSRFDVGFLEYVNTDPHKWSITIGVPYGTAYWQVADSTELNGQFKLHVSQEKRRIFQERISLCQGELQLLPTDIIPIVNVANAKSFANVKTNKHAIATRGWFPYNRNLLLHPDIRASMTETQKKEEYDSGMYPSIRLASEKIDDLRPSMMSRDEMQNLRNLPPLSPSSSISSIRSDQIDLNFNGNLARSLLKTLVRAHDLQEVRKEIMASKTEEIERKDRIKKMERFTAANLITSGGTHTLGVELLDEVKHRQAERKQEHDWKKQKQNTAYLKLCSDADAILSKCNDPSKWNVDQIKAVLKPLKRKSDAGMPATRKDLVKRWNDWRVRKRHKLQGDTLVESAECMLADGEDVLAGIGESVFESVVETEPVPNTEIPMKI